MSYRNAKFNKFGTIDLEYEHPTYGWIPFTASPNDVEEHGRALFEEAIAGPVTPYKPPAPLTIEEKRAAMPNLNPGQIRLALLSIGITEDMVDAALANDAAGMIEWKFRPNYVRTHPLIDAIGTQFGITPVQIDSMWYWAADL